MDLQGKVIVVTGAARGIGKALAHRFAKEQPAALVLADLDGDSAARAASECGGVGLSCDVGRESSIQSLIERTRKEFGRIDVFCSNAGVLAMGGYETSEEDWDRVWRINVGAHIWASRHILPEMLERGSGCLIQVISAAGLLTMLGSASYSVSKHAAFAYSEWLAITYGARGIQVAAVCPLGVRTDMLGDGTDPLSAWMSETAITPEQLAETTVEGVRQGQFLILPHAEVRKFFQNKANDYERWMSSMQGIQKHLLGY